MTRRRSGQVSIGGVTVCRKPVALFREDELVDALMTAAREYQGQPSESGEVS